MGGYGPVFGDWIGPPRQWWAWYPVRTFDGMLVWLRPVIRRRAQTKLTLPGPTLHWWEYFLPGDA